MFKDGTLTSILDLLFEDLRKRVAALSDDKLQPYRIIASNLSDFINNREVIRLVRQCPRLPRLQLISKITGGTEYHKVLERYELVFRYSEHFKPDIMTHMVVKDDVSVMKRIYESIMQYETEVIKQFALEDELQGATSSRSPFDENCRIYDLQSGITVTFLPPAIAGTGPWCSGQITYHDDIKGHTEMFNTENFREKLKMMVRGL